LEGDAFGAAVFRFAAGFDVASAGCGSAGAAVAAGLAGGSAAVGSGAAGSRLATAIELDSVR
jgi:hypothetical protein